MKLEIKVLLLVVIILFVLGGISTGILIYYQRQYALAQFQETAGTVTAALQGSLEQCMLTGDRALVQEALVSTAGHNFITETTVFRPGNLVAASSQTDQIGQVVADSDLSRVLQTGKPSAAFQTRSGIYVLQSFNAVINQPACQECHRQDQIVLGAIGVTLDTSTLTNHLRLETILTAILGLLTFIFLGGSLAIMLNRTVLNRLSGLARAAQKVSEGQYSSRTAISGGDEIGVLSQIFNKMAESVEQRNLELQRSHQQLVELNSGLEAKVELRTKELSAMNTLLDRLSRSKAPKQMLEDALSNILMLMNVEAGVMHIVDRDSLHLIRISDSSRLSDLLPENYRKKTDEIANRAVQTGNLLELNDKSGPLECGEFRALISVPLKSKTTLGVLTLASFSRERFQPETTRLLTAMCDAIGIALENANAARSVEEANAVREQLLEKLISAQEEERRRIARELHDEASQSLAALAVNLEDIADVLPEEYKETKQRLDVLKERVVTTLSGIRSLALQLRPSALDDLGLIPAIDWYAKDLLNKRGLDTQVRIVGQKAKLPSYTETILFRIVQESLTNVVRHAEATRVSVELRFSPSEVALKVEDNGKGFDVSSAMEQEGLRQNLGIHGMMERAALLGGILAVQSRSGQGTVVTVTIPLAKENGHSGDN
jgi:signal transduction histidine kinase